MTSLSDLQSAVFAAIEDAKAEKRQAARIRYRLRKRALQLRWCRIGWAVMDYGRIRFAAASLDQVEEWARRLQ